MPRDEQEFLSYIARHFRLVELLCSHVKGFESDSELHSFLDANSDGAESTSRQAKRLKDVGVLIEGASGWIALPFLSHFLRQLHDRTYSLVQWSFAVGLKNCKTIPLDWPLTLNKPQAYLI